MIDHNVAEYIKNSTLRYCIDEYVRKEQHQRILKDKWFGMYTFEEIAEKYNISVINAKRIVYEVGDPILLKAGKLNQN